MVVDFMVFDFIDILQQKRRHIFVALFLIIDLCLLSFGSQTLQAHRSNITTRIDTFESSQAAVNYQGDVLGNGIDSMPENIAHAVDVTEVGVLRIAVAAADGVTTFERSLQAIGTAMLHGIGMAATATAHGTSQAVAFASRIVAFPFVAVGHGAKYVFGTVSRQTNIRLASAIQPKSNAHIPVITPAQAQQAVLIQSGTLNVEPVKPTGSGGACDSGAGNGGYPIEWCDAPMDTIRTVSYSSDHINRECTSYAYWYFTAIEGHTDFHVSGNANRWARTSNYPTHKLPSVGAIAVETTGTYGHVAVVQALPGQAHEGKVVPAGYVLVSEMNYDWHGHFRYSYSPLSKFSAYIY
jgi:surface antigen